MSLFDFDKALFQKIRCVYDEVIFGSPDEAFKINASMHGGRVVMPFVSVWRLSNFDISRPTYNDPRVRDGAHIRFGSGVEAPVRHARALPVTLYYQIDVYSNKRTTCDGIAAELALFMMEYPWVDVRTPVDGITKGLLQQHAVTLNDSISDNTSISDFEDTGRIYRLTLDATIPEALIYRIDRTNAKLVEKVLVDIKEYAIPDPNKIIEQYEFIGVLEDEETTP